MTELKGTNIASTILPFTTEDKYASHDSKYGKGGWREVATVAERDEISVDRRTSGMAVYVTSEAKLYILNDDLTTWTAFKQESLSAGDGIEITPDNKIVNTRSFACLDISDRLTGEEQYFIIKEDEAKLIGNKFILLYNGVWQVRDLSYTYNPTTRILTTLFSENPSVGESLIIVYVD